MITQKERELGSRFALINIVATVASFVILAFVIGPDQTGYDESLGPITNLIGLAQGLSFLGIVRLSGKLFNSEENPLLAGAVAVAYGTAVATCDFADTTWTSATITAAFGAIYNDDQGDKVCVVLDFGGSKTCTNGTFKITFPDPSTPADAIISMA